MQERAQALQSAARMLGEGMERARQQVSIVVCNLQLAHPLGAHSRNRNQHLPISPSYLFARVTAHSSEMQNAGDIKQRACVPAGCTRLC
jgi:hypothetical protein